VVYNKILILIISWIICTSYFNFIEKLQKFIKFVEKYFLIMTLKNEHSQVSSKIIFRDQVLVSPWIKQLSVRKYLFWRNFLCIHKTTRIFKKCSTLIKFSFLFNSVFSLLNRVYYLKTRSLCVYKQKIFKSNFKS